jgi:O-antigen ligase
MFWTDAALTSEEYFDHTRYFLMLVFFIMATMLFSANSNKFLDKIIFWLCLVVLVTSVVFILIFYASHIFPKHRVRGLFDYTNNPNQAAMYFGYIGLLASNAYIFSKKGRYKIFYGCTFLVLFTYMLLSQSRGPIFAFIASVVVGFLLKKRWKEIILSIVFFLVFIILVEKVSIGVHSLFERGFADRIDIWLVTFERIAQVPFFGEGYFTDVSIQTANFLETSPHNLLLLITLKSGLIGGALLLILLLTALMKSYKYFIVSGNGIYLCMFIYFIFCMTFDSTHLLYKPTLGWLIFWMPVALIAAEEGRIKSDSDLIRRRKNPPDC